MPVFFHFFIQFSFGVWRFQWARWALVRSMRSMPSNSCRNNFHNIPKYLYAHKLCTYLKTHGSISQTYLRSSEINVGYKTPRKKKTLLFRVTSGRKKLGFRIFDFHFRQTAVFVFTETIHINQFFCRRQNSALAQSTKQKSIQESFMLQWN